MTTKALKILAIVLPASAILLLAASPQVSAARIAPRVAEGGRATPPTAFLRHQVQTRALLIQQLAADGGARTGYAKLFHITPGAVVAFVRQHAASVAVPVAGKYTVWRVTREGTIYPTVQTISQSESAFEMHGVPRGLPNFISNYGDPMKPFATAVTVVEVRPAPVTRIVTRVAPSQETIVPTQPQEAVVPVNEPVYAASTTPGAGGQPASAHPEGSK